MFEQTLLDSVPNRKAGVFAASLTAQVLFVGTLLLIPLIYTDRLSIAAPSLPMLLPLSPPTPVEAVKKMSPQANESHASLQFTRPFRPPLTQAHSSSAPVGLPMIGAPPVEFGISSTSGVGLSLPGVESFPRVEIPLPVAAPRAPEVTKPVRLTSEILAAKIIRKITPAYPRIAILARVSGTVRLMGIIGKDGSIQNLQILSGHPMLVKAAMDAVSQWLYSPTLLNGQPVEVTAPIDVVFTLGQ